jgi:hypothetical protein
MALDQNTRLKVFINFGTRSNVFFGTRSEVLINFGTRSKVLIMVLSFQSSAKIRTSNYGTRSKVLIMVFLALKTFDLVIKVASSYFGTSTKV